MTQRTKVRIVIEIDVPEGAEVRVSTPRPARAKRERKGNEKRATAPPPPATPAQALEHVMAAEDAEVVQGVPLSQLDEAERDEVWWADEVLRTGGSDAEKSRALERIESYRATAKARAGAPETGEDDPD